MNTNIVNGDIVSRCFFNHHAMSLKFALLSFEFGFTAANNVSRGMTRKGIKELLNKETDLLFCNQIYSRKQKRKKSHIFGDFDLT